MNLYALVLLVNRFLIGFADYFRDDYHIALVAKVPLVLVSIDYETKTVYYETSILLSGDKQADRAAIASAYAGRRGYNPANESPIDW